MATHLSVRVYGFFDLIATELDGYCNFSYGSYILSSTDSLVFSKLGPSEYAYCLPDNRMEWEGIMTNNLKSSVMFSIIQSRLIIESQGEYGLEFNFVENL